MVRAKLQKKNITYEILSCALICWMFSEKPYCVNDEYFCIIIIVIVAIFCCLSTVVLSVINW